MSEIPKDVFRRLKEWLREKQANYVEHSSWNGDTEGGFYSTDEFNFELLCEEIDKFHADLKAKAASGGEQGPQEDKA